MIAALMINAIMFLDIFSVLGLVTVVISFATKRTKTDEELKGLVYQLTPKTIDENNVWYKKPTALAIIIAVVAVILSIIYW